MTKEKDEYYYPFLTGKHIVKFIDIVKFPNYIKGKFFNYNTSQWLPSKYKAFVKRNDLDFNTCYNVLSNLNVSNVILKRKGFDKFLNKIEKYNSIENKKKKIKIREGFNIEFIKELIRFRGEYFDCTNEEFIEMLTNNFDTGLTKNTLRKYFSEKKFEE